MITPASPRPEFDNPPVSEVAVSVQFAPLPDWQAVHGGLYWGLVNTEYPRSEMHPPLMPQIERFGADRYAPPGPAVQFVPAGVDRFWFMSADGTRLIQLQNDRFVVNWRKVTGGEKYPRYELYVRPTFETEWEKFKKFIETHRLGDIEIQQCELSYVNDILRGEGWDTVPQALSLFSFVGGKGSIGFLPEPESFNTQTTFLMPDQGGRLYAATQHVVRTIDQRESIQFRLVARGVPEPSDVASILKWFDLGHDWIVRGFTDLTTRKAHDLWKRRR